MRHADDALTSIGSQRLREGSVVIFPRHRLRLASRTDGGTCASQSGHLESSLKEVITAIEQISRLAGRKRPRRCSELRRPTAMQLQAKFGISLLEDRADPRQLARSRGVRTALFHGVTRTRFEQIELSQS